MYSFSAGESALSGEATGKKYPVRYMFHFILKTESKIFFTVFMNRRNSCLISGLAYPTDIITSSARMEQLWSQQTQSQISTSREQSISELLCATTGSNLQAQKQQITCLMKPCHQHATLAFSTTISTLDAKKMWEP